MAASTETGNAKNIINFQNLIHYIKAYGESYKPSKNALKIKELENLVAAAQATLTDVTTQNANYNTIVNSRANAFSGLKTLATRIINALQITDASSQLVNNAKTINRKIQGQRRSAKPAAALDPNTPAPNTISTSQQSYTQLLEHLFALIALLKTEASYKPNEEDLKITSLEALHTNLTTKNNEVATAYVALSNARIARNAILYSQTNSIYETAAEIKKYIKSIYGTTSPQFAQIKGIEVKKLKV